MNRSLAGAGALGAVVFVVTASVLWLRGTPGDSGAAQSPGSDREGGPTAAAPDASESALTAPALRAEDPAALEAEKAGEDRVVERGPGEVSLAGRVTMDGSGEPAAFAVVRASASRPGLTALDLRGEIQKEYRAEPAAVHSMQRLGADSRRTQALAAEAPDGAEDAAPASWSGLAGIETVAGEDGRFRLEGLPGRAFFVSASLPGYRQVQEPWTEVSPEQTEIVLTLAPAAQIRGHVTRPDGAPAAGAKVRIFTPFRPWDFVSGEMTLRQPLNVSTDEQGSFTVSSAIAPSELHLMAKMEGFAPSEQLTLPTEPGESYEANLVLAEGAALEVTVTDGSKTPVPGARVRLVPVKLELDQLDAENQLERGEDTDEHGTVRFTGLRSGELQLSVRHEGSRPSGMHKVTLRKGETTEESVELQPGLRLPGRVISASGEAIPGARVRALRRFSLTDFSFARERNLTEWTHVQDDGSFVLEGLPEGSLDLEVEADGWNRKRMEVEAGGAPVDVVLAPMSAIEGIVVSRMTGTSVTDFELRVDHEHKMGFNFAELAETMTPPMVFPFVTEKGRFRVEDVPAGTYLLEVVAEGHARYQSGPVEVKDSEVTRGLVFYLEPESVLEGSVRDAVTQEALAGVRLDARQGSVNPFEQILGQLYADQEYHSDDQGSFRVGGLSAGEYTLVASHPGYAEATRSGLRLGRGETLGAIAVALGRGGEIFGTVFDDKGTPSAGVTIFGGDATGTRMKSAKTDLSGGYRISGLSPGRYSVTRMPASFSLDAENSMQQFTEGYETRSVALEAGQVVQVDFGLQQRGGVELRGLVLQKGTAVPGLFVTAVAKGDPLPTQGSGGRTSVTDASGRFTFKNLEPGQVMVQVQVTDTSFMMPSSVHVKELDLDAGVHEVVFDLPAGEIRGVLEDARTHAPAAGVPVYASEEDVDYPQHALWSYRSARGSSTRSGADGSFTLHNVGSGRYRICAGGSDLLGFTRSGYALTQVPGVEVPVSGTLDLGKVLLQPEGVVLGVVRSRGEPVPSASLFLRPEGSEQLLEAFSTVSTDGAGNYRYSGVPEGTYTVVCRAPGFALEEESGVRVRPGAECSVDFELEGGTAVYLVLAGGGAVEGPVQLQVTGPHGTIVSGMFGFADMIAAVFEAAEPGVYFLGTHAAGKYHARGSVNGKPFDAEFELRGEPEVRIPVKLP